MPEEFGGETHFTDSEYQRLPELPAGAMLLQ